MPVSLFLYIAVFGLYFPSSSAVKVSVYYETLCPDSINFLTNQLHPNYESFGDSLIELELIPFGKATEQILNKKKIFTCQHGPEECYGNKIHGCVINSKSIEKSEQFVNCAESGNNPTSDQIFSKCASDNQVAWSDIKICLSSGQADEILDQNGKKTEKINLKFVPTVVFNDVFKDEDSSQSLRDLKGVLCKYLNNTPPQCKSGTSSNTVQVIGLNQAFNASFDNTVLQVM